MHTEDNFWSTGKFQMIANNFNIQFNITFTELKYPNGKCALKEQRHGQHILKKLACDFKFVVRNLSQFSSVKTILSYFRFLPLLCCFYTFQNYYLEVSSIWKLSEK